MLTAHHGGITLCMPIQIKTNEHMNAYIRAARMFTYTYVTSYHVKSRPSRHVTSRQVTSYTHTHTYIDTL